MLPQPHPLFAVINDLDGHAVPAMVVGWSPERRPMVIVLGTTSRVLAVELSGRASFWTTFEEARDAAAAA